MYTKAVKRHRMTPLAIKALMLRITSGRTLFRSSSSWLGVESRNKDLGLKQGENWNGRSKPLLFQEILKPKDGCSKKKLTLIVPWECFCRMTIVFLWNYHVWGLGIGFGIHSLSISTKISTISSPVNDQWSRLTSILLYQMAPPMVQRSFFCRLASLSIWSQQSPTEGSN